jgi:hypothetical protein
MYKWRRENDMGSYREDQEMGSSTRVINEDILTKFTTRELSIEIERRKGSRKDTFCKLVDDMYDAGFTYHELKEILDNI